MTLCLFSGTYRQTNSRASHERWLLSPQAQSAASWTARHSIFCMLQARNVLLDKSLLGIMWLNLHLKSSRYFLQNRRALIRNALHLVVLRLFHQSCTEMRRCYIFCTWKLSSRWNALWFCHFMPPFSCNKCRNCQTHLDFSTVNMYKLRCQIWTVLQCPDEMWFYVLFRVQKETDIVRP